MGDTYFRKYTCTLQGNLSGPERDFPSGPVVENLPTQGTEVGPLPRGDPTCHGAAETVSHNC